MRLLNRLGEAAGIVEIRVARLPPEQIGMLGEGDPALDAMVDAGSVLQPEEALGRALAGEEFMVALVDVRGDQPRALGVGSGDQDGRDAADVGGETGGIEVADMRLCRDQDLAAEVAAFLLGRELVLEMNAGGAGLDIGLHDLEAVQWPAEAGLGVGDDRREPVPFRAALAMLDLVGALEGAVDPAAQLGPGIGGVERLVGIHGAGRVGVGGDLPAREIDGLEAGADHLHRLVAGHGAERVDIILALEQLPQPVGAAAGEAVLDRQRSAQPFHILDAIGTANPVETAGGGRDQAAIVVHRAPFEVSPH